MTISKMINFDSFTLIPSYSDIQSRNEVDISTNICELKSELPIINANMLSICSPQLINGISNYNTFCSCHRFFNNLKAKKDYVLSLKTKNLWMSLGTKEEEYEFIEWLHNNKINKVIIDVNHGHHKSVKDMITWIKKHYPNFIIMAGNVSSTEGIQYLVDAGADIIKIGNSFGFSCTTIKATGFGVHPMHVAKSYREDTGDWDTPLCLDGGIRDVSDIVKCLIYGNIVMLGKMFAGCDESGCIIKNGYKEYYGNASAVTKTISNDENHIRYIEGKTTLVELTGKLSNTMNIISDGIRSGFSFVGARNLDEFQRIAPKQMLFL